MSDIVITAEELRLLVKAVVAETVRELNQATEKASQANGAAGMVHP